MFSNNEVTIFKDGREKFGSFFKDIENAKESIHLEYYIVKSDKTGEKLKNLLIKKAIEGVEIKFIMDKIGSGRCCFLHLFSFSRFKIYKYASKL